MGAEHTGFQFFLSQLCVRIAKTKKKNIEFVLLPVPFGISIHSLHCWTRITLHTHSDFEESKFISFLAKNIIYYIRSSVLHNQTIKPTEKPAHKQRKYIRRCRCLLIVLKPKNSVHKSSIQTDERSWSACTGGYITEWFSVVNKRQKQYRLPRLSRCVVVLIEEYISRVTHSRNLTVCPLWPKTSYEATHAKSVFDSKRWRSSDDQKIDATITVHSVWDRYISDKQCWRMEWIRKKPAAYFASLDSVNWFFVFFCWQKIIMFSFMLVLGNGGGAALM